MWSTLFAVTNAIALLGWALLAAFPRKPLNLSTVLYLGVAMLCLCYTAMFAVLGSGLADPGGLPGAPTAADLELSIPGIRALFMTDGGIVTGWTHYLAFDLFTGLWIARDADAKGFSRWVQLPFLAVTLVAGPIGLLGWLLVRERRARAAGKR